MIDIVDKQTRSRMMAAIRGKDTKPEMILRRGLHAVGCRFRLHRKDLPGSPDLVFSKHDAVLFVHGCFWHRHTGCKYATTPATRPEFWAEKFKGNVDRDRRNQVALANLGWRVGIVWECSLKGENAADTIQAVSAWLMSSGKQFEI
ncbi:very short patch repair endonuclease [Roseibium aggregatum]|uniref:very short patch repair endonuclease n=1 Tax=Roseibium aggregatum TaxID=187304 RepID=UPI001E4AD7CB|nr:DNA mismatch endonuclease Vsr [Roseibium aggregatum]UES52172.1 DNA mismatch endonuclease Vsr [Roseibium aggregatum]